MDLLEYRQRAQDQLAELLNPKPYFRQMAIDNLERLRMYDPDVVERLRGLAGSDPDEKVRSVATHCAEALLKLQGVKDHDVTLLEAEQAARQTAVARPAMTISPADPAPDGLPSPLPDAEDRIPCPFCAEMIKPQARICRYCHTALPAGIADAPFGSVPVAMPATVTPSSTRPIPIVEPVIEGPKNAPRCPNCGAYDTVTEDRLRQQKLATSMPQGKLTRAWTIDLFLAFLLSVLMYGIVWVWAAWARRSSTELPAVVWCGLSFAPLILGVWRAMRISGEASAAANAYRTMNEELTHLHVCNLCGFRWDDRVTQATNAPRPTREFVDQAKKTQAARWASEGRCVVCGVRTTSYCPICHKPHCDAHIEDREIEVQAGDAETNPVVRYVRQGTSCIHE